MFNFTALIYIIFFVLKQNIQKIIEEELVISKTVSRPETLCHSFDEDGYLCYDEIKTLNTMTCDFLGKSSDEKSYSNYYCGQSKNTALLEEKISQFLQTQATFITGSYEGLCVEIFEDLLNKDDIILYDSAVSPWLRKGIKICDADKKRFFHNDMSALENFLKLSVVNRLKVIVTDGIFYDSGECADLQKIRTLAEKYGALVIIDDSFGFLTCGKKGHGADEVCGVKNFQELKIVNMQNSLCCSTGAFVSGDKTLTELLKLRSKSLKNTLSTDEKSILRALDVLQDNETERQRLAKNAINLYEILNSLGYNPQKPVAGIVSFISEKPAEELRRELKTHNLIAAFSKAGKNTLASFKVSAKWQMEYKN